MHLPSYYTYDAMKNGTECSGRIGLAMAMNESTREQSPPFYLHLRPGFRYWTMDNTGRKDMAEAKVSPPYHVLALRERATTTRLGALASHLQVLDLEERSYICQYRLEEQGGTDQ